MPEAHTPAGAETALFDRLGASVPAVQPHPTFILGAPRTGSTLLYQAICGGLRLPYIANLTNDMFPETPIVGLAIQKSVPVTVGFANRYGKTEGPFQPSEGSVVMTRWFGGGHPSALVSARIRDGMEPHFLATLAAAEALFGAPLVIKNAWNCFRVAYLAEALPAARFIWIRRDIAAAAKSDLAARHATKGSATEWNSATPANVEELRRLLPAAQVVENQDAFNTAIATGLRAHADGRWQDVWYEDLCADPSGTLTAVAVFLGRPYAEDLPVATINEARTWRLPEDDEHMVDAYLAEHRTRLSGGRYSKTAG